MEEQQITEETPQETPENEPETFSREYVQQLRQEAAEGRTKAKEHEELASKLDSIATAYREALCREASAGVLHEAIQWDDAFNGEDGLPDVEKIREAVGKLADEKPWLSRPRGDVGQGFRGQESDSVNLAGILRAGA